MVNDSKNIRLLSIYLFAAMSFILFAACEDVIDIELEEGDPALVVDAWLNDQPINQEIYLRNSQAYFDNTEPPAVTDASISVIRNDGNTFNFIHQGDGRYVWQSGGESIGEVGHSFNLEISTNGELFTAQTEIFRVPEVDSIGVEFRENELFFDDGLYAQFYARDFEGRGDTYWIKSYKNDTLLNKTQEINLAFDAGFDAGTGIDGLIFIPPIRELVNALDEDLLSTPYDEGDRLRVEIHSISNEAFNFMEIARDQINNGDNGIFSIPLANTRSNVAGQSGSAVLGFFNVAAISSLSVVIEE